MSKHRKPTPSVLTAALLVGGFVVVGVLIAAMLPLPQDEPDPLVRADYVIGAEEVRERTVDAGNTSREMERVATLPSRHQQMVDKRELMRQEKRKDLRREARRQAADQAEDKVTPVVVSPSPTSNTGSSTPSGGVAAQLPEPWLTLARCESSLNPTVVSSNGLWFGLFQFTIGTWQSVGGTGLPSEASVAEQLKRAQILQSRSGWGPWPVCGANL